MRFTVRSLGGKLIISAALTLLLCMLLFVAGSWLLLTLYYEHAAIDGANRHLASIKNIYRNQVKLLVEDLKDTANRQLNRSIISRQFPSSLCKEQYLEISILSGIIP